MSGLLYEFHFNLSSSEKIWNEFFLIYKFKIFMVFLAQMSNANLLFLCQTILKC